jgi:hypothetical protein
MVETPGFKGLIKTVTDIFQFPIVGARDFLWLMSWNVVAVQ